ncbi:MAG TPA: Gfo/Idh/MocA family oxidoreductase [Candidatus Acidoferrales bacterium]|nr:Gfo/Idh/MocA family oxidoreductase [Candidatus Acidoferrales bacterium]
MKTNAGATTSGANFNISRRRFLKTGSALAAMAALPALGADALDVAQGKPKRVGLIGAGWYGKSDLWRLLQVAPVEVVSICDVDQHQLAGALEMAAQRQKSAKKPRGYSDYRQMLQEKDLEIVLVGTPDHWHALAAIAAMEAGADVYCQKPISADVIEGEAMLATARKLGRVVQVGTQRRSTPHWITAKKQIVDAGLLGNIGLVEMCCYYPMRLNDTAPSQAVPDFLDYEMWTGPAPLRPYDGLPHRGWWRGFMAYGNGIMGDMCVHMFDGARWLLDLGWPKRVTSAGGIYVQKTGKSDIADTQTAIFEYDGFNAVWQHRTWGTTPEPDYPWALFIHGDKGTLKISTMRADYVPTDWNSKPVHLECVYEREQYPEDLTESGIELNAAPATRRHLLNFLAAIETRSRPVADIEQGHISTASCILANLSMKAGRTLSYDPAQHVVVGDPEATSLLRRSYRAPWTHPELG